jgi:hypothetical protein
MPRQIAQWSELYPGRVYDDLDRRTVETWRRFRTDDGRRTGRGADERGGVGPRTGCSAND